MILKTYHPIPKFPPISLSGTACQLNCLHCNRAYLRGMQAAVTPEALLQTCRDLKARGAIGILISGGSTRDGGILNLPQMAAAIRQAKVETGLIVNIHPGLMARETVHALHDVVDFASLEIPSTETVRDVFGLDATTEDYIDTYERMQKAGMAVVPHIAVYDGGEDRLLAPLCDGPHPEVIVVIVFTPTRDTPMADADAPSPDVVGGTILRMAAMFPQAEVALGCMRPRVRGVRVAIELAALEAGATRMELPSRRTLDTARRQGYAVERYDACCAIPAALEARTRHRT